MKKEKHKITNIYDREHRPQLFKLKLGNEIHWTDIPLDGTIIFPNTYPLDSDLIISGG